MDELIKYNKERWEELAKANVLFSRPALNLDEHSARHMLDPYHVLEKTIGSLGGKRVLCLAGGGGQQSVAFALLGAHVTIYDLSETQLQRDREAATYYGFSRETIETLQGDMRDLSCFENSAFDIVWQPPAINFVPDARQVFAEAARVIRPGGLYRMDCSNPFVMGTDERDWNGIGYSLKQPYIDGAEVTPTDPRWEVWDEQGNCQKILGPKEFRHSLGTLINGMVENGFVILGLWEELSKDPSAVPGRWDHLMLVAPQGLSIWSRCGK